MGPTTKLPRESFSLPDPLACGVIISTTIYPHVPFLFISLHLEVPVWVLVYGGLGVLLYDPYSSYRHSVDAVDPPAFLRDMVGLADCSGVKQECLGLSLASH